MTVWYHYTTALYYRSVGHIPAAWESIYEWEEGNCWNCGGEFVLERENPQGGFEFKTCWTCQGIGINSVTVEPHPADYTVFDEFPERGIFQLYGQSNVWNPP